MSDTPDYNTCSRVELARGLDSLEVRLKVHINDAKIAAAKADEKAEQALKSVDRAKWMIGGGTGLLVSIWAIYSAVVQVWALLTKGPPA